MDYLENERLLNEDYQIVGRKTPRKYYTGVLVILLSNISLSIISITLWPYLFLNHQSILLLGISIALFHGGSFIGRLFFSNYLEKTKSYWLLLFTSLVITLVGDILYAAFPLTGFIPISRFIVGFGSASQVILQGLLTDSNDSILAKLRISKVALFTSIAYIVGPAVVASFSQLDIKTKMNVISSKDLDGVTLLSWMAAFLTFISIIITVIGKILDNSVSQHYHDDQYDDYIQLPRAIKIPYRSQQTCIFSPRVTLLLFCFVNFLLYNTGMIIETLFIPFVFDSSQMSHFNWNLTKISLFFMGLGISSAISSNLIKRITNYKFLLFVCLFVILFGYGLTIDWHFSTSSGITTSNSALSSSSTSDISSSLIFKFIFGVILIALAFQIAVSTINNLFFEIFDNIHLSKTKSTFQISNLFGRVFTPIFSSILFVYSGSDLSFLYGFILTIMSIVLLLSLKKSMKYINSVSNIQKNHPIITEDDELDTKHFIF